MGELEVIIMCGIPGSGKTTFCRERLFPQYLYILLDRLKSRSAEAEPAYKSLEELFRSHLTAFKG